jgi:hypothetical protein
MGLHVCKRESGLINVTHSKVKVGAASKVLPDMCVNSSSTLYARPVGTGALLSADVTQRSAYLPVGQRDLRLAIPENRLSPRGGPDSDGLISSCPRCRLRTEPRARPAVERDMRGGNWKHRPVPPKPARQGICK